MIHNMVQMRNDLKIFVLIISILSLIGLIFIYSSSSIYALERTGSAVYFVLRQLMGLCIGISCIIILQYVPTYLIGKISPYALIGSQFLTLLTFVYPIGQCIHGANRWIKIGPLSLQPSELLKMALIIYISYVLSKKDWSNASYLYDYLPLTIIIGLVLTTTMAQPDFGLTTTIAMTLLVLFYMASFRIKHLIALLSLLFPCTLFLMITKPYRLKRILIFLDPWSDQLGAGFQIIQSLIAIGTGHIWGLGIGNSHQKFFYLPMQHTDFIFSIIAEEVGLVGSVVIIILYIELLHRGLRIATHLSNPFARFVLIGFSTITSMQALINMAVASGIIPTKGTGLPFISYGPSALVCNCIMVGIIINLVHAYD